MDELAHQFDAPLVLKHINDDTARTKQRFLSNKGLVFTDHHARYSIKKDCAAAHRAWRQRRINRAFAVYTRRPAAGIFQGIHFGVEHDASLLHPAIVSSADDFSLMHEDRADRNASLAQSLFGFLDCGFQEFIH